MTQRPTFDGIQKQHQELLDQISEIDAVDPGDPRVQVFLEGVSRFLNILAQAGTYTENGERRSLLRDYIRYWSSEINKRTGNFPIVQLQPFEGRRISRRQVLIGSSIVAGAALLVGGIIWEEGRNNPPAPSPTPTSSPLTATPTPSPAPSPPSVLITAPTDGSQVSIHTTVQGTAQNIPKDEELWLFIVPSNQASYFPQPGPIKILGDKWSIGAYFGVASDVGLKFTLIPVLINQNDQEAHNAIKKYFQLPGPVYQGIQPTSGMQLMFPEITVVRV